MRAKKTIKDYQMVCNERGFTLVSDIPASVTMNTTWMCSMGHQWSATYHSIVDAGSGCPYCAGKASKVPKDYHDLAMDRGFQFVGLFPNRIDIPTTWRCQYGHEWLARYGSIKSGYGCPICSRNRIKTIEDYHDMAREIGYTFAGDLPKNTKTKADWICASGHVWITSFNSIKNGSRCSHCSGNARLSTQDYHDMAAERGFTFVGHVVSSVGVPVTWRCSNGHTWDAAYYNIKSGRGCPRCSFTIIESNGEKAVADALIWLGIEFEREKRFDDCRDKRPLPFDFYFEHNGIKYLCEYNGAQHYRPIDRFGGEDSYNDMVRRDRIKSDWAIRNGYTLIIIDYTVDENSILKTLQDALPEGVKDVGELWAAGYAASWAKENLG